MTPALETDPEVVSRYLRDAAHYPGGRATGVMRPGSVGELAEALRVAARDGWRCLPVGAQSSLTGGATPFGDVVISTERLTGIDVSDGRVRVGAGEPLQAVQDRLAAIGRWLPPMPTYAGAFAGGAVATCAAGAATFKYGTVRDWVDGLTVVLAGGEVLALRRGQVTASPAGRLDVRTAAGVVPLTIPPLRMPDVPKRSAGYFLAPGMDLVDLFIGAEGTLGVVAEAVFRTAPRPAAVCHAFVPVATEPAGIALVGDLRDAARATWAARAPHGIDVSAIEHLDARALAVLREDGVDRRLHIDWPDGTGLVLLVEIELPRATGDAALWSDLERARDAEAPDAPLRRFCRLLDRHGVLESSELALPGHPARAAAFAELREAVPAGVNRRVAHAQHAVDARISKTAADMIVPFDRFGDMMAACRALFAERGLDLAVWGHISDGNVHPNVIPASADDVRLGQEAILLLGQAVIAMGGCPMAEHGVGRNPVKQALLRMLYGDAGVAAMRAIKAALDPGDLLAGGVIFPR